MPKNVVIFSDGTNNAGSVSSEDSTNVWRLYKACPEIEGEQVTFYDAGLGSRPDADEKETYLDWSYRYLSMATGLGISWNIRQCYDFLAQKYEPGDKVFLFGFSRGAYTVRSLGGVLSLCGIIKAQQDGLDLSSDSEAAAAKRFELVEKAYGVYQTGHGKDKATERKEAGHVFTQQYSHKALPHFVGVWDTVSALGLPGTINILNPLRHKFHDAKLNPKVPFACQALSVDENRKAFAPVPWEGAAADGQRIAQYWFPGVHSDVGGGYTKRGLADITLDWMVNQATSSEAGLIVDRDELKFGNTPPEQWHTDDMHNERKSFFKRAFFWKGLRSVSTSALMEDGVPVKIEDGTIAQVTRKRAEDVNAYRPPPLEAHPDFTPFFS